MWCCCPADRVLQQHCLICWLTSWPTPGHPVQLASSPPVWTMKFMQIYFVLHFCDSSSSSNSWLDISFLSWCAISKIAAATFLVARVENTLRMLRQALRSAFFYGQIALQYYCKFSCSSCCCCFTFHWPIWSIIVELVPRAKRENRSSSSSNCCWELAHSNASASFAAVNKSPIDAATKCKWEKSKKTKNRTANN